MKDKIVKDVIKLFKHRSAAGIKKYGTTLEQNNTDDFIQHLQEELMDAILYLQKIKDSRNSEKPNMSEIPNGSQTEISDDDIEEASAKLYTTPHGSWGFVQGAKWYREQLKKKQ
jgi:hypothetical protein